jgi:hypothetical protein
MSLYQLSVLCPARFLDELLAKASVLSLQRMTPAPARVVVTDFAAYWASWMPATRGNPVFAPRAELYSWARRTGGEVLCDGLFLPSHTETGKAHVLGNLQRKGKSYALYSAKRAGLPYVLFVHLGDVMPPNLSATLLDAFEKYPEAAVISAAMAGCGYTGELRLPARNTPRPPAASVRAEHLHGNTWMARLSCVELPFETALVEPNGDERRAASWLRGQCVEVCFERPPMGIIENNWPQMQASKTSPARRAEREALFQALKAKSDARLLKAQGVNDASTTATDAG